LRLAGAAESLKGGSAIKTHELTRRDLLNFAGTAAIGLSARRLAGCASTAAVATESTEGSGAALASTCPPAIRTVAVAMAISLTLLISAAALAAARPPKPPLRLLRLPGRKR